MGKVINKDGRRMVSESRQFTEVYGTINEVIASLQAELEMIPAEYRQQARFSLEKEPEPYSSYEYAVMRISWERPETVEEFAKRKAQEAIYTEQRRKTYEALKKEFG